MPLRGTLPISGAKNAVLEAHGGGRAVRRAVHDRQRAAHRRRRVHPRSPVRSGRRSALGRRPRAAHPRQPARLGLHPARSRQAAARVVRAARARCSGGRARSSSPIRAATASAGARSTSTSTRSQALGAEIDYKWGYYYARVHGGLRGADLRLAQASVTGTENLLMSAVLAEGPDDHSQRRRRARGRQPDRVSERHGRLRQTRRAGRPHDRRRRRANAARCTARAVEVIPDRIEAGSFAIAAAVTGGELFLEGARADHLGAFLDACRWTGIQTAVRAGRHPGGGPAAVPRAPHQHRDLSGLPDRSAGAVLAGAGRRRRRQHHQREHVRGPLRLRSGACSAWAPASTSSTRTRPSSTARASCTAREVEIPDLRAGATLVLAALAAEGESRIVGTEHVARGYEDLVGKLGRVGARITEEQPTCVSRRASLRTAGRTGRPLPAEYRTVRKQHFHRLGRSSQARRTCWTAASSPSRSPTAAERAEGQSDPDHPRPPRPPRERRHAQGAAQSAGRHRHRRRRAAQHRAGHADRRSAEPGIWAARAARDPYAGPHARLDVLPATATSCSPATRSFPAARAIPRRTRSASSASSRASANACSPCPTTRSSTPATAGTPPSAQSGRT